MDSIVIGFGHRARQGKNTVVSAIIESFNGKYDVREYSFASTLKREVREAFSNNADEYWLFLDKEREQPVSSFFERVSIDLQGCWLWSGKLNDKGYGIVYTPTNENYRAHRFMWEVVLGNEPAQLLRHSCDVRNCVNPLHLQPGTPADNSTDMVARLRSANGENHSQAVLTDVEVAYIRELVANGMKQVDICKLLELTPSTVSRIVNNQTRIQPTHSVQPTIVKTDFGEIWLSDEQKTKFRKTLQHYGTEYRRNKDEFYWVKALEKIVLADKPQFALVSDMRFQNEFYWVKSFKKNGWTVKVARVNYFDPNINNDHPSEKDLEDAEFDITISCLDGDLDDLKRSGLACFEHIVDQFRVDEKLLDFDIKILENEVNQLDKTTGV